MNKTSIYPLNTTDLEKGQDVDPHEHGHLTALQKGTKKYQLGLLSLREQIMRESDRIGMPLSVRIKGDLLHINTDSEATQYHHNAAVSHLQGMGREAEHLRVRVDRSKLGEKEQLEHDRRIAIAAMRYQAARGQRIKRIESAHKELPGK